VHVSLLLSCVRVRHTQAKYGETKKTVHARLLAAALRHKASGAAQRSGGCGGGPEVRLSDAEAARLASFEDLLLRCLAWDPVARASAEDALAHPFFSPPSQQQ
jgi:hypothetical protein